MKQDKFLTGILIGIGVLILLALGLFFTRQDKREYVADATPDGVVHNYVLAVLNKDQANDGSPRENIDDQQN